VLTMNSVKILHAVRSAITAIAELLVCLRGIEARSACACLLRCVLFCVNERLRLNV